MICSSASPMIARADSVSIAIGKDARSERAILQDLRDERSEDAEGRIENLAELVCPQPANTKAARPSQRLAASSIACPCSPTSTRKPAASDAARVADDAPQRQEGSSFRWSFSPASEEGLLSALAVERKTKRSSRKSGGSAMSA